MAKGMYENGSQIEAMGNVCASGSRARYSSERYQRGLIALTNASGALSIAKGTEIALFQHGVGGDADGAGYPTSAKFTDAETNVNDDNGIRDCIITTIGVSFGRPVGISGSGDSFTIAETDVNEPYEGGLIRTLSENLVVLAVTCPGEEDATHNLGSPSRMPSHRGINDHNFYGAFAMPGVPVLLAEQIEVPLPSGSKRPFKIVVRASRAMTFAARSTAAVGTIYVPVTVGLEIKPRG